MSDPHVIVARSLPLPGLGLLVLPQAPVPAWLAVPPLYTALRLRLHRLGQPPLPMPATIEEVALTNAPPTRALLLDADPGGAVESGAWLELLEIAPPDLLL